MRTVIYDPDGQMHEVPRDRAAQIILEHGWTQTKPEIVEHEEVIPEYVETILIDYSEIDGLEDEEPIDEEDDLGEIDVFEADE